MRDINLPQTHLRGEIPAYLFLTIDWCIKYFITNLRALMFYFLSDIQYVIHGFITANVLIQLRHISVRFSTTIS